MGDLVVTDNQMPQRDAQGRYLPGHTDQGAGRHSVYTDDMAQAIADNIRTGTTPRYAALAAGITEDTFYEWIKTRSQFSELCARAKAEWMKVLSDCVTRAVVGDPTYKGCPKTALRALELRDKRDWGPSLDLRRLDVGQLLDMYQAALTDGTEDVPEPALLTEEDVR